MGPQGRQGAVSRHAKCYRARDCRARNWVTHERTDSWERPEWDHRRHESIWDRCGIDISGPPGRPEGICWMTVCEVTGYHRKAAIRLLRRAGAVSKPPRRGRPVRYGPEVVATLQTIWTAAGYPWSVRLKALLPLWLPWPRRRLSITPATEAALGRISARQIDRRLEPYKRQAGRRLYGRTKPGPLLKQQIPCKRRAGMSQPRLHRDRSRLARGRPRGWGVSAFAERDRHPHQVGGNACGDE